MGQYLPIVALTVLAILFAVISLLASKLLAPNRPNTAKEAPYECGIVERNRFKYLIRTQGTLITHYIMVAILELLVFTKKIILIHLMIS